MAKYTRFEDLPVWREASRLYNRVQDLFEETDLPLSSAFKTQLDRAAISVSNNIAEGFERATTSELVSFLAIAKGSAGEVRSMLAVVKSRPNLLSIKGRLDEISSLADSCARQIMGWIASIESGKIQGKRHLNKEAEKAANAARDFRKRFLQSLKPDHPLYKTEEALLARGEQIPPD